MTFLVKAIPAANVQRLRISVSSRIAFYTDNCNGLQVIKIVPGTENTSLIQVDAGLCLQLLEEFLHYMLDT